MATIITGAISDFVENCTFYTVSANSSTEARIGTSLTWAAFLVLVGYVFFLFLTGPFQKMLS